MLEERARTGTLVGDLVASGFACRRLGETCWLLTYALLQDGVRRTRRSTIWERVAGSDGNGTADGVWRIVFHQGTVVSE